MIPKINFTKKNLIAIATISVSMILMCLLYVLNDGKSGYYSTFNNNLLSTDARPNYKQKEPLKCLFDTAHPLTQSKQEWEQCLDAGNKPEYYLSIVIVTRMDDYAG
jgi:hypothetical protein